MRRQSPVLPNIWIVRNKIYLGINIIFTIFIQMQKLKDEIQRERPNISPNTVKTYVSLLSSLHRKIWENEDINMNNFNQTKKVMEALKDKAPSSRKTTLSALYILTGLEDYKNQMHEDIKTYMKDVDKQTMNEKQKASFISPDEIAKKMHDLKTEADHLYKKSQRTDKDRDTIQNYIILCLTSGSYIPPRRALDWTSMKWRNAGEKDNTMEKGKFIFRNFKGSNKKGQQEIAIPRVLQAILKKWISILPAEQEYLLVDINQSPLDSVKMNQRLNKILKRGSAINALRHSYLTSRFGNLIEQNEKLEETMQAMGSSSDQQKIYIQKTG